MLDLIGMVLVAIGAIGIPLVGYLLLADPIRAQRGLMTVEQLGIFEATLPDLKQVVVMCHQIEDPKDSLRAAVTKNFGRHVKYKFLVSKSRAKREEETGYRIFQVLADMVIRSERKNLQVSDLVRIQSLPYDWEDTPYIFYQLGVEGRPTRAKVLAVRGNEMKEGIASRYSKVDPRSARTILRAVLSDAPLDLRADGEVEDIDFSDDATLTLPKNRMPRKSIANVN